MKLIYLFLITLFLQACAYSVHQVHVGDFKPAAALEKGNVISSRTEQKVFMGFTQETEYVNRAYYQLASQCDGGYVTGITTQLSTDLGFFSWTNRALMQGLCVKGSLDASAAEPTLYKKTKLKK